MYQICDYIFRILYPSLVSHLKSDANYTNLYDYFRQSKIQYEKEEANSNFAFYINKDLSAFYNNCLLFESNLVYFEWILSLARPLLYAVLLFFAMPTSIIFIGYALSFMVFFRKHWSKLKSSLTSYDFREACKQSIALFWEAHGALFHAHEIVGLENLPDQGAALLIYYHAAIPIDYYYVYSKCFLYKNRCIKTVADKFLFRTPGLNSLLDVLEATPGSYDSCVSLLKEGHILSISPGGAREAVFSDHNYEILWGKRLGFARVACEAKIPVIPMFTKNNREAVRAFPFFRQLFKFIYERTRLPLVLFYGFFPVKLVTFMGEPIQYDASRSPEQLKELTKQKIQELIIKHQKVPGSIFCALKERFTKTKHE